MWRKQQILQIKSGRSEILNLFSPLDKIIQVSRHSLTVRAPINADKCSENEEFRESDEF